MGDLFAYEPDPYELTVTPRLVLERDEGSVVAAALENGIDVEGVEVELRIPAAARSAYGVDACVEELERFLNSMLGREYRLESARAMAACGAFTVAVTPDAGPLVLAPDAPDRRGLAA